MAQHVKKYFHSLQVEYFIARIRKAIYPSKDEAYYIRVMEHKENKISSIAEQNGLSSIFDDEEVESEYYNLVYKERGFPNFGKYMKETDMTHYYKDGVEVKVYSDGSNWELGIVESLDLEKGLVSVLFDYSSVSMEYGVDRVTRSL